MIRVPVCKACRSIAYGMEMNHAVDAADRKSEIRPPTVHWTCVNLECPSRGDRKPVEAEWVAVEEIEEIKS